jgi:hypothetical protein
MPTAVTSDVISDLSITTAKLANQAVTAAKVASGAVVQVVNAVTGSVSTGTTIIPADDTIPQITEGNEYMTLAVTPLSATNKLRIDVVCIATTSAAGASVITAALFQDATAGALACMAQASAAASQQSHLCMTYYMTAGTTSATTFRVRIGGSAAGTTTFNGSAGARLFGGSLASSITITEIKA